MATKSSSKSSKRKSTPAGRQRSRVSTSPETSTVATTTEATKPEALKPDAPKGVVSPMPLRAVPTASAEPQTKDAVTMNDASEESTDRAKRPDLLDAITARTALKRPEVKLVMDLFLEELGTLLETHEEAALPPLGKLMVKKRVTQPGGEVLTLKLKRPGKPTGATAADSAAKDDDRRED